MVVCTWVGGCVVVCELPSCMGLRGVTPHRHGFATCMSDSQERFCALFARGSTKLSGSRKIHFLTRSYQWRGKPELALWCTCKSMIKNSTGYLTSLYRPAGKYSQVEIG